MPFQIFPDYRHANPFQTLLYADVAAHHSIGPWKPSEPVVAGTVLHLQWEDIVFRDAPDADAAMAKVEGVLRLLTDFRARGGRLIWTLHNITSHTSGHGQAEARLREGLIALADAIHLLSAQHRAVLERYPGFAHAADKVFVIPHPSYRGHYQTLDRAQARALVGAGAKPLFFFFGAPRQGRVYDRLQEAIVENPAVDKVLSIPGSTKSVHTPSLKIIDRRLSDVELAVYGSAADFSVMVDADSLNSGTLFFYLSYEMKVFVDRAAVRRFDLPGYPEGLCFDEALTAQALNERLADPAIEAEHQAFLADFHVRTDPASIAARFLALVDELEGS
jgi:hypothetical protein